MIVPFRGDITLELQDENRRHIKYFYFSPKMLETIQFGISEEEFYSKYGDEVHFRFSFPDERVIPKFLMENLYIPVNKIVMYEGGTSEVREGNGYIPNAKSNYPNSFLVITFGRSKCRILEIQMYNLFWHLL